MAAKNDHILLQRDVNKAEHPSFCPCVEGTTKLWLLQPHLPIRGCGRQVEGREEQGLSVELLLHKEKQGAGKGRTEEDAGQTFLIPRWKRVDAGPGSSHES